jgi:predicted transcriptional regulator
MAKETITIRIDGDLIDSLDAEAEDRDVTRSEYVRQILRERHEGEEIESLREQLDSRQERIKTLEEQLAKRSNIEQKVEDLPDKLRAVEEEPDPPWPVRWYRWLRSDRQDG